MEGLAAAFPLLVFVATLALVIVAFRLDRRVSRGARSAGPRDVVRPPQVGLQQTPWELAAIDDQVRSGWNSRGRVDLVNTVNRLTRAAGITDPSMQLPANAADEHVAAVIGNLEQHLELPPLVPSPDEHRLGSITE